MQGKAEDAGGLASYNREVCRGLTSGPRLAPAKDDCAAVGGPAALRMRRTPCGYNAAMQFPDR